MDLYSYSYSIPYIIVIFILFVLAYLEDKLSSAAQKNKCIVFAVFLLSFFFGLRGFVQSDFQNYYPWFEDLPSLWNYQSFFKSLEGNYEPGFVVFTALCKSIIPNYFFWVFVSSLIDVLLLQIIFKRYSTNVCLSFAIYFAIGAIIMEFNLMRNIKAILILIFALKYIHNKKMWKYFFCVFLATLFHLTSVIFIPLYFVLGKKWPKMVLLGIFMICITVLFLHIRFLSFLLPKIASVLGGELAIMIEFYLASGVLDSSYGVSLGLIERIITFAFVFYFYGKWVDKTGDKYIFANMMVIYFMCFSLLAEMSVLLERFAYFFAISYCVFYPNLLKVIKISSNKTLVCCFIFLIFTLKIAQQTQTIVCKYDNILFGVESFENRLNILNYYNANIK